MSKGLIYLGSGVGGTIGGYVGGLLDHGNYFGLWSIIISAVGGLAGIYVAYKIQQ